MNIVTGFWADKAGDKKNKKKKVSVRIAMLFVLAAAWLVPIVFLSFFIFNNYQTAYIEKTENLTQNVVNLTSDLISTDLDAAITKLQKPTYDGEWETLYTKYEKGQIARADFLVSMKSSLISRYYMDDQFSRFAFYLPNSEEPCSYSGKNGYGYEAFIKNVQPLAMEISKQDSNYVELLVSDNQIYLIRNLYTVNDYRKYGTLVVGIDKNNLINKLPIEKKDAFFISVGDNILTLSNNSYDSYVNSDSYHFVRTYTSDNYEFSLHYFEDKGELYKDVRKLNNVVKLIVFAMIPLIILSYVYITRQIEHPLKAFTEVSGKIEAGEVGSTVDVSMPNKEFEGLAVSFNSMSSQVKKLIDTVYLEQIAAKDAIIDALQAQINPHFLNNTLEMMNWQARMNGDIETSKMIESLGTVLDFSINRNHNKLVRLSDEVQCADAFLYIMSMRFGQRLKIEKEIDDNLMYAMVPSLVLQPLLENAIKYGVERVSQGTILLKCFEEDENLIIEVINTGKHIDEEGMQHIRDIIDGTYSLEKAEPGVHTSIGIFNVNKRIRLIFGNEYGLSVHLTEDDRFVSKIIIPITKEDRK